MKLANVYPSNSPFETAADHVGARFTGKILAVEDCSFEKEDGSVDPALGVKIKGAPVDKLVKVNKTCAKILMAAWDVDDTDDWIGREVIVSTQFYPRFNNHGWIVDPVLDQAREAQREVPFDDEIPL